MIKYLNRGCFSAFLFTMLLSHTLFLQAMYKSGEQEKSIVTTDNCTQRRPQSVEIKKNLSRKYGSDIMNNASYQPSCLNALFCSSRLNALFCDNEEKKKDCLDCIIGNGCILLSVLGCFCWYKSNLPHECVCGVPVLTSLFCLRVTNDQVEKCFRKKPQKKDQRHGIQEISSLEDMEYEIIDK